MSARKPNSARWLAQLSRSACSFSAAVGGGLGMLWPTHRFVDGSSCAAAGAAAITNANEAIREAMRSIAALDAPDAGALGPRCSSRAPGLRGRRMIGRIVRMPRLLALTLAVVLLVPGRADAKVTCDSGKTVYKH